MTTNCTQELSSCIYRCKKNLEASKKAILLSLNSDKIDLENVFHMIDFIGGSKRCEKTFDVGGKCHGTKYSDSDGLEYGYDEYQRRGEKAFAEQIVKELRNEYFVQIIDEYSLEELTDHIKSRISKSLDDGEEFLFNNFKTIREKIKNEEFDSIKSKLEAMLEEREQEEDIISFIYKDIIKAFCDYISQCNDLDCFNRTIEDNLSQKQSELADIKNDFLHYTEGILQHIQVDESSLV